MMRTVAGDHKRFEQTYFTAYKGYYFTGGCRTGISAGVLVGVAVGRGGYWAVQGGERRGVNEGRGGDAPNLRHA